VSRTDQPVLLAPPRGWRSPGLQRPGIARPDFDIDHAVAVAGRHDADIVKNPVRAHQALGLFDEADRDALAGLNNSWRLTTAARVRM